MGGGGRGGSVFQDGAWIERFVDSDPGLGANLFFCFPQPVSDELSVWSLH